MAHIDAIPEVLKWAREYHNLGVGEAAALLKIAPEVLEAIENGKPLLNATILKNMISKYKLSEATLLLRHVPTDAPKPPEDYRTLKGRPSALDARTMVIIRDVHARLDNLAQIMQIDPTYKLTNVPIYPRVTDPTRLGESERSRLGVSIDEQLHWRDADLAFRTWRKIVETSGISVCLEEYPLADCQAFSIRRKDSIPAIVINKSDELSVVRTFSLIHELGHLVINKPGLSDMNDKNQTEAFCNRFAGSFLMPIAALEMAMGGLKNQKRWEISEIVRGAKALSVSQQSLALRLEKAGYAPNGYFEWFCKNQPRGKQTQKKKGRIPMSIKIRGKVGYYYTKTVLGALDMGMITQFDASRLFDTSLQTVTRMKTLA
jgi:Zn-dependent peptidase ImmA (M78 family)